MSILEKEVRVLRTHRNQRFDSLVQTGEVQLLDGYYMIPIQYLDSRSTARITKICDFCGHHISNCSYRVLLKRRVKWGGRDICQKCSTTNPDKISRYKQSVQSSSYRDSEETRRRKRDAQLGRKHSEESRKKRADTVRKTMADPVWKELERKRNPKTLKDLIIKYGEDQGSQLFLDRMRKNPRRMEYYLLQGLSEEKAKEVLSKFQSRGINYWTAKYGEVEGEERWAQQSVKKVIKDRPPKYSKESYLFFESIISRFNLDRKDCFFGPEERYIVLRKKERILLGKTLLYVDFTYKDIVIEYNGEYWHQDPEQDLRRLQVLRMRGYRAIGIHSLSFRSDPERIYSMLGDYFNESTCR